MLARVWGLAVAVVLLFPAVASGDDRVSGTVSLFGEQGEVGPPRVQRVFDTAHGDTITASLAGNGSMGVTVDGPSGVSLEFGTPDGGPLRPGVYTRAKNRVEPGRPRLLVAAPGCEWVAGRFEVRSFAVDASGRLRRAWVLFEQSCVDVPPLFGELRIGYPRAAVAPAAVRWPALDLGRAGPAVPVRVRHGRIASAAVAGPAASDFALVPDACGGCETLVRFTPSAPGVRTASLRLTTSRGDHVAVPLEGFAYGGVTSLDLQSEPGDSIGGGVTYHYDLTSRWTVWTAGRGAYAVVYRASDEAWTLQFDAPPGQVLAPGTYTLAPDPMTSPRFRVSRSTCSDQTEGWFTVHGVTNAEAYDARSPAFSISFEQRCGDDAGMLRGTINFRAGDATAPAPWMVERIPRAEPNAALRTAIAIENRLHAAAVRAFRADVKKLEPAFAPRIGEGIASLAGALDGYARIVGAAAPTSVRLKAERRVVLRRLARESTALTAFARAASRGFDRATRRARDRLLRELAR